MSCGGEGWGELGLLMVFACDMHGKRQQESDLEIKGAALGLFAAGDLLGTRLSFSHRRGCGALEGSHVVALSFSGLFN